MSPQAVSRPIPAAAKYNLAIATVCEFAHTHDAAGRIRAMDAAPSAEHWTYSHDEIDRLLGSADSSDIASSRSFPYNNAGSILTTRMKCGLF